MARLDKTEKNYNYKFGYLTKDFTPTQWRELRDDNYYWFTSKCPRTFKDIEYPTSIYQRLMKVCEYLGITPEEFNKDLYIKKVA